jgi:PAS domain S-box-containing protein
VRIDQFISSEVIDRLVDGRLLVGVDGSILDASRAALDCYGYSLPEMLSLNIRDISAPQGRDEVAAQMLDAAEKGCRFETDHRRSDGALFPVEVVSAGVPRRRCARASGG